MFKTLFKQSTETKSLPAIKYMTTQELAQQLAAGEPLFLLDVRSAMEYQHDGHITGSRLIPLNYLNKRLSEMPADQTIVCICRSGNRSLIACEMLAAAGFENVVNLNGGLFAWQAVNYPVRR